MRPAPPRWSDAELTVERNLAEQRFVAERKGDGPAAYYAVWEAIEPKVRAAIAATGDLRKIEAEDFGSDKLLWQVLRYVCAPRISEEDLWTMVGKKFRSVPPGAAAQTARVITDLVDVKRFPWVVENRMPSKDDLEAAIMATTTLLAHEQLNTNRRGSASRSQEDQVSDALLAAGCALDTARSPINVLDELARGSFARERKVGGAKCDIPIRLRDGRLLALECKVSNGPKNSWKRLSREIGGKAETWRNAYGQQI